MPNRRSVLLVPIASGLLAATRPALAQSPSNADAASGVRAALERGAGYAVDLLGKPDGFLGNPKVRIELPGALKSAAKVLKALGQQKRIDELVTGMNRAAERAVPEARALLLQAARSITLSDALRIVRGGDDSVTRYFADKTRQPLTGRFLPIVSRETGKLDLAAQYNAIAEKAAGFGVLKGDAKSVEGYVTARALDGLYKMIGEQERKIRQDPVGTGSALLAKVFGR